MTKKQFLEELEKRLSALPKEEIQSRVSFYEEAIDDRMEEGKSEEEAVAEVGPIEDAVWDIVKETPLVTLVKEKVKPKRKIRAWEIVLICLGFPIWFPLLITALVLVMVAYILAWVLVIVTYSVELATSVSGVVGVVTAFALLFSGQRGMALGMMGASIMCLGFALLWFFACKGATIASIKLTRAIILSIKKKFVKRG